MEKLRSHGFCAGAGDCDHHRTPFAPCRLWRSIGVPFPGVALYSFGI